MLLLNIKYFVSFCPIVDLSSMLGISFQLCSGLDSNLLFKGKDNLG